jgi:hypothetical protein
LKITKERDQTQWSLTFLNHLKAEVEAMKQETKEEYNREELQTGLPDLMLKMLLAIQ